MQVVSKSIRKSVEERIIYIYLNDAGGEPKSSSTLTIINNRLFFVVCKRCVHSLFPTGRFSTLCTIGTMGGKKRKKKKNEKDKKKTFFFFKQLC